MGFLEFVGLARYAEADIEGVMHGNFVRFLETAWAGK